MSNAEQSRRRGRGTPLRPDNRFVSLRVEPDPETVPCQPDGSPLERGERTEFLADRAKSIISQNDSPDVGFRWSLNPYRGCEHGCSYCYARPTHEFLGLDAGLDFETKIFVKHDAASLFRDWLNRPAWQAEPIAFSGVTDCYQPAEQRFGLTRACLEVAVEARQPVSIVTKNALITRDIGLLVELNRHQAIHASVSLTTLDVQLARAMEPRTSPPAAKLRTIRELADEGIPVRVMVAPVIPGLTDSELPAILEAAAEAGAGSAAWLMLRLPGPVEPIFTDWLDRMRPTEAERVKSRLRSVRAGRLNDSQFGRRMRGTGPIAEQIAATFDVFARRFGLERKLPPLSSEHFRPPRESSGQMKLF